MFILKMRKLSVREVDLFRVIYYVSWGDIFDFFILLC